MEKKMYVLVNNLKAAVLIGDGPWRLIKHGKEFKIQLLKNLDDKEDISLGTQVKSIELIGEGSIEINVKL